MAAASSAPRKPRAKPAVSDADAAAREAAGDAASCEFQGLTLTLPAKLPASLALRLGKLQHVPEDQAAGAMYAFVARLVTSDQMDAVMDRMDDCGLTFEAAFQSLLEAVVGAYGGTPGE